MNLFFSTVLLAVAALIGQRIWRQHALQRRLGAIRAHSFPQSVRLKFRDARPHLDSTQEHQVFEGLRDYFILCAQARGRFVSMPSQVADDAWHAFILHTRYYQDFCSKAFGRFLHHTPAEVMRTPTLATEGIQRAWRLACALERIDPKQPKRLPRLFALDGTLNIADGFRYDIRCIYPDPETIVPATLAVVQDAGGSSGSDGADSGGGGCGGGD